MSIKARFGGISRAFDSQNYRYYWIGGSVSILGFWFSKLALGLLAWQLTYSPFWLGIIGFSAAFPAAVFSPFAGAIADRYGLRRVALFALFGSAFIAFTIGFLTYSNRITIEVLTILVLLQGVMLAFDLPARQALVYYIVQKRDLSSAIAINTTTFHLGAFIGPGLFAISNTFFGLSFAFFFNAVSFLVFSILLICMNLDKTSSESEGDLTILDEMIEGIKYAFNHHGIFALLSLVAACHLFIRPYMDLLPAFSDLVFVAGETGFAALAGVSGLGSSLGGLWLAIRGKPEGLTKLLSISILIASIALIIFSSTTFFYLGLFCMFVLGFALITIAVSSQSLIQNAVEPSKRARVISLTTGIAVGFPAVGAIILGSLGDYVGIQLPLLISAILCASYWILKSRRLIRQSKLVESNNG